MTRIRIALPEKFIFTHSLVVRINDINYGGHTGNDIILQYMHEGRMNFLKAIGLKDEITLTPDTGWIVADAAIEYKAESFFGDVLNIYLGVDDIHKYGFDMIYQIIKVENGKEIARGKTGLVFFNYNKRKVVTAPEEFMKIVNALPAL